MAETAHPIPGKVAFITGAARGIGAGTARGLAAKGAKVALAGLEGDELERVAASIGPDALAVECDVTDPGAIAGAVEATVERFGGIDIAMANAGIGTVGFTRTMDPAAADRVIEVNLLGVMRTNRAVLPALIERRGYLLNVASVAAVVHTAGMAPYSASKAGCEAWTDALRCEVAHLGVDVGCAYYHWIDTDMVQGADRSKVGAMLRDGLKGPLGKTFPLSAAVDSTVAGIEHRSRRVLTPGWLRAVLLVRGLLNGPATDRQTATVTPEADRVAAQEAFERGAAASAAVGAGGEADTRAREGAGVT
jgi:NAD(P)-dependent dehydrogenase (short-subunit alcohol dehydrogenase family)